MVELASSDEDNVKIGQRVMVTGGHRGTVLYIGPVPPNKGTYLGIDWDDPSRGKHDGVYEGVRYFTARNPTSASFVRKEKVNLGRSCADAIKLRYGDNPLVDEEQLLQVKKALNAPFLEMVGFEAVNKKQSCFENLEIVWLHDYAVSYAGEFNELKQLCPKIRELDLSKNLLSNWFDIAEITRQLDNLTLLNLSENVLRVPDNNELDELNKLNAFTSLKYIVLISMNYTWYDIIQCAVLWPNIQHLRIPFNKISSLELPENIILKNLSHLDLEGNNIRNWEEINKLGVLPKLQLLNLTNTGISEVAITSSDYFRSLKHLILSQNNISCWIHISELNKLNLEELRFRENPVLKYCNKETSRQLIIAKIASLKMLNGQEITREERRGAEYDYIKKYGQLWHESRDNDALRATFIKEHSRYLDLTKKYGEAESSEYVQISSKLKSSLLKLEIIAQPTGQVIRKSLPRTMLVQRFSSLIQKLFNTGSTVPVLYVVSKKNPELKLAMENNLKNLDFYSIEDDDKILVEW